MIVAFVNRPVSGVISPGLASDRHTVLSSRQTPPFALGFAPARGRRNSRIERATRQIVDSYSPRSVDRIQRIVTKPSANPPDLHLDLFPDLARIMQDWKAEIAGTLSTWMTETLGKKGTLAAVVARGGSWQSKTQDCTGMEHSGIAIYHPLQRQWIIHELMNQPTEKPPQKTAIFQTKPFDFFQSQPHYDRDALLLIPDRKTQLFLWLAIMTGRNKKLHFTPHYNLVTPPASKRSLNCNKWALMNVMAAKINNYNPKAVLQSIEQEFSPGVINVPPILRPLAKQHPTVFQEEVPVWDPIKTVTVESLYHSDLFQERLFFKERPNGLAGPLWCCDRDRPMKQSAS